MCADSWDAVRRASYIWKKRYGSMGMTEVKELRQLRDENARLKRLVADLTLDKNIHSEVVRKRL